MNIQDEIKRHKRCIYILNNILQVAEEKQEFENLIEIKEYNPDDKKVQAYKLWELNSKLTIKKDQLHELEREYKKLDSQ